MPCSQVEGEENAADASTRTHTHTHTHTPSVLQMLDLWVQHTGWGKSRFTVVSTRKSLFLYYLLIVLFSIQTTVNVLVAHPVYFWISEIVWHKTIIMCSQLLLEVSPGILSCVLQNASLPPRSVQIFPTCCCIIASNSS